MAQTLNVLQRVRFGPSLAAALQNSIFEYPAEIFLVVLHMRTIEISYASIVFRSLLNARSAPGID